jgi:hypothetical protein
LLLAPPAAAVGFDGFGFRSYGAASFHVIPGLKIPNDGLFQIFLNSAPNGSEHVDVWLFYILAQTAFTPSLFRGNVLVAIQGEIKPKGELVLARMS